MIDPAMPNRAALCRRATTSEKSSFRAISQNSANVTAIFNVIIRNLRLVAASTIAPGFPRRCDRWIRIHPALHSLFVPAWQLNPGYPAGNHCHSPFIRHSREVG